MKYRVYVGFSVSQVVDVDAESIEEAIELAIDEADQPNASNKFEMDGEFVVRNVTDEAGDVVWDESIPDPSVPS